MKEWLQDLKDVVDAGVIDDGSMVVALTRNSPEPLESDSAWVALPIVSIDREEADLDLMPGTAGENGLTVGDLRKWLDEHPGCDECIVYVPGQWVEMREGWSARQDIPAIGPVVNGDEGAFGVMVWYEGCEDELRGPA